MPRALPKSTDKNVRLSIKELAKQLRRSCCALHLVADELIELEIKLQTIGLDKTGPIVDVKNAIPLTVTG